MALPIITLSCVSNLFTRQMHFVNAGDTELGHTHPFNHITLLASGSANVTVNGKTTSFVAPAQIVIAAEDIHSITATASNTLMYCIHPLRESGTVEDIIDPTQIPEGSSYIDLWKKGIVKPVVNPAVPDYPITPEWVQIIVD